MTEPVSWRDVRDAVGEAKREILLAIDDLRRTTLQDHELRLRAVEDKTDAVQFLARAFIVIVTLAAAVVVILRNLGLI